LPAGVDESVLNPKGAELRDDAIECGAFGYAAEIEHERLAVRARYRSVRSYLEIANPAVALDPRRYCGRIGRSAGRSHASVETPELDERTDTGIECTVALLAITLGDAQQVGECRRYANGICATEALVQPCELAVGPRVVVALEFPQQRFDVAHEIGAKHGIGGVGNDVDQRSHCDDALRVETLLGLRRARAERKAGEH
jgi:hypothetical protein